MSERFSQFGLCLVRSGVFVRRLPHAEQVVDPTTACFELPGFEQEIVHPRAGGGDTTVVVLSDEAMPRYAGDVFLPNVLIPIGPDVQLLHVALLADLRQGIDDAELDARLTTLIGMLVEQAAPGRLTARRPSTSAAHRRIVDKVREVIAADPASVELGELAADLGHSPFHVSRVFHRATGTTLTQHRNRVRVAAAIDRLAAGEDNLADLAADLGFADQSHLARVLRRAVGLPPGRLQHWLAGDRRTPSPDLTTRSKPSLPTASYPQ